MGLLVRAFSRRNLIAIAAGMVLAGAPLIAFNFWLDRVVDTQGRGEVTTAARRAISLAESRLNQTISALDELVAQGVNSCASGHVEAMRQTAFNTSTIKEVAIVGPDGQTLCTHLGPPLGQRKAMTSEPLSGAEGYTLDIIQIANGQRMVQLRHSANAGPNALAAMVPVILLLPQVSVDGSPFSAYAQVVTHDGILIGSTGERPEDTDARFAIMIKSGKLGVQSELMAPRDMVPATHGSLNCSASSSPVSSLWSWPCSRSCCRAAGPTIRSPTSSVRSPPANSCPISSRSSISARANYAAPRCWCAGANRTARWCSSARLFRSLNRAG